MTEHRPLPFEARAYRAKHADGPRWPARRVRWPRPKLQPIEITSPTFQVTPQKTIGVLATFRNPLEAWTLAVIGFA